MRSISPLFLLLLALIACQSPSDPTVESLLEASLPARTDFQQQVDGKQTDLFVLKNAAGMQAAITNYGGRLVSLLVPDKQGKLVDVVLGFDGVQGFIDSSEPYFGATIGRYGNRIAEGQFELDGTSYQLATNNGPNSLHGGPGGFHHVVWDARKIGDHQLELTYESPDEEEGFPGNLSVKVVYSLSENGELQIDYTATTDQTTVINLTNHAFFNLNGEGSGSINDHKLMVNAEAYTPVDGSLIPTGEIAPVAGTPFDFREPQTIGSRLGEPHPQFEAGNGYDHNFALVTRPDPRFVKAATVWGDQTGIVMEVYTEEPGLQFYGGNFLDGSIKGKGGKPYEFRTAFCLETQHFPDSPNQSSFPSTQLKPGETYQTTSLYRFLLADSPASPVEEAGFESLLSGPDFEGWYTYLREEGKNQDPNQVFQMKGDELHISGEQFGYLCTEQSYEDFHLRLEFRWGDLRHAPRLDRPRDSGICYRFPEGSPDKVWPKSFECQIQEADCGDYWLIDSTTIEVNGQRNEPKNFSRFFRTSNAARPHGEWNRVEIICQQGVCQHWINGVLVNEGKNPSESKGKILLQSEGAEIVFRKVSLKEM